MEKILTIFGMHKQKFVKKINIYKAICIAIACVTVALNLLFTLLRNDDNHVLMLVLNILVDVFVGWFMVYFVNFYVLFYQNLLKLYDGNKVCVKGQIMEISSETQKVQGLDCYSIVVGRQSSRILFLPTCFDIRLELHSEVTFSVVSNVIVEIKI